LIDNLSLSLSTFSDYNYLLALFCLFLIVFDEAIKIHEFGRIALDGKSCFLGTKDKAKSDPDFKAAMAA
jgi:hypothetical protein